MSTTKVWQIKCRGEGDNESHTTNAFTVADILREVEESILAGAVAIDIREMRPIESGTAPKEHHAL